MYRVTQEVRFCYGHRLMDYVGRCARIHGHNARVELVLAAPRLDARGFVMDFDELHRVALTWIDETLDHRLLLRRDDPAAAMLRDAGEDFVALEGNPTAEFLARLIHDELRARGVPLCAVRFWETDGSLAEYAPAP